MRKSDPDGLTIEYTYDAAGNLVSRVSPSQSLVYTYDARNRLETVTRTIDGAPPQLTRYAHDAAGNRREMQGADGTRTEYAYDARHRLTSLIKRSAAGALLVGMAYTVDASGMRTGITESDAAGTTRTVAYAYDALKRLTAEAIAHRDPTRNRTSTWTYDRVGNRLTQIVQTAAGTVGAASAATQYTYDANDRLTSETTTAGAATAATLYTYDANGNTLQKVTPAGPIDYTYDDASRLAEMRQFGARTTYAYDADGLRIGQTLHPASGDPVSTRYLQDPSYAYSQVIEQWRKEGAGATQLEATYAFADDLIAQTRYAGAAATTVYVQADGFGSVRWLTDAAGVVTDAVEYDAFGNEIGRQGVTPVEHLYRGEQFDSGLGFYYLRARWMDPGVGRFSQQDAFVGVDRDPLSLNKFVYAGSDPINLIDPSGYLAGAEQMTAAQISATLTLAVAAMLINSDTELPSLVALHEAESQIRANAGVNARRGSRGMPVIFYGSDVIQVTDHIDAAQAEKGITPILTKLSGRQESSWARSQEECFGRTWLGSGLECDEYPFAVAAEGGRKHYPEGVSLRPLNQMQNSRAGQKLRWFFNRCGVSAGDKRRERFGVIAAADGMPTSYACSDGVVRWDP